MIDTQPRIDLPKIAQYLFYILIFCFFFGPISWLLLASINTDPTSAWAIPRQATLNNYVQLFQESDIVLWLHNSFILAIGTMIRHWRPTRCRESHSPAKRC
jgi:ABC-type glycerol-3-phosphate transport system permease component